MAEEQGLLKDNSAGTPEAKGLPEDNSSDSTEVAALPDDESADTPESEEQSECKPAVVEKKGRKESLYDKIPLTKKQLDIIIIFLAAAIIIFLLIGTLLGNGII